jgi:hypothetical protein
MAKRKFEALADQEASNPTNLRERDRQGHLSLLPPPQNVQRAQTRCLGTRR